MSIVCIVIVLYCFVLGIVCIVIFLFNPFYIYCCLFCCCSLLLLSILLLFIFIVIVNLQYCSSLLQYCELMNSQMEVVLSLGQKQGDKSFPLLFGLVFNALLLALKATGVGYSTGSALQNHYQCY